MLRQNPSPSQTWNVLVFMVSDQSRQQEVLRAFHQIDDLGLVALGTRDDPHWFVVVDCPTNLSRLVAQSVVKSIDPDACVSYRSRGHAVPAS